MLSECLEARSEGAGDGEIGYLSSASAIHLHGNAVMPKSATICLFQTTGRGEGCLTARAGRRSSGRASTPPPYRRYRMTDGILRSLREETRRAIPNRATPRDAGMRVNHERHHERRFNGPKDEFGQIARQSAFSLVKPLP